MASNNLLMVTQFMARFLLAILMASTKIASSEPSEAQISSYLKRLNKPALKSIKSPDGDIIDCVPFAKQPAFDHPLLRNHTIQMAPSFRPRGVSKGNKDPLNKKKEPKGVAQLWHLNGRCPENTVPIRRTRKEDLLRAVSIENYGKKSPNSIPRPQSDNPTARHEYAVTGMNGEFYGTKAKINVWKPKVQTSNEFSLAQLWIVAGDYSTSDLNTIEVGWQVYQQLYGDDNTRLFIYWTRDAYQNTGCYNHHCSGFVQVNNDVAIGGSFQVTSGYNYNQYEIVILVWKDPGSGNWWMEINDKDIGYWPASLFTHLVDSASLTEWGGEIVNRWVNGQHTGTQMGSGRFAEEWFRKSSYIRNIETVDGSNYLREATGLGMIRSNEKCYNIKTGYGDPSWGTYFFFGGPGRNPNCP